MDCRFAWKIGLINETIVLEKTQELLQGLLLLP